MNREEIQVILDEISYFLYKFECRERNGVLYLQASFPEADIITNKVELQKTRKWMLSEHMVKSEIVQTALKCALTSAEHSVREHFLYRRERIFGPHFDVEALYEVARARRLDYRK